MFSLSLVMPAFNEAEGIAEAVAEANESLVGLGYDFEIIVVDDGSSDATADCVREVSRLWPRARLVRHERNLGYGAALRTGFEAARMELVAFTDADCQFHLDDLEKLIPLSRSHPVVVGRRIDRQDPWLRRFLSWGYNRLASAVVGTGVRDVDCALKVFRRDALMYILPETSGFFVNTEMISRARQFGWGIGEVGVRHRPRRKGVSKVSLMDVPRTFSTLAKFWWTKVLLGRPGSIPTLAPVAESMPESMALPAIVHEATVLATR